MTLAEVAARYRKIADSLNGLEEARRGHARWIRLVLTDLEADPDFSLGDRLEALIHEWDLNGKLGGSEVPGYVGTGLMRDGSHGLTWVAAAERLRRAKEGKP